MGLPIVMMSSFWHKRTTIPPRTERALKDQTDSGTAFGA